VQTLPASPHSSDATNEVTYTQTKPQNDHTQTRHKLHAQVCHLLRIHGLQIQTTKSLCGCFIWIPEPRSLCLLPWWDRRSTVHCTSLKAPL
jgi:hypothetical protein